MNNSVDYNYNIDNYSISDLEKYFNLDVNYNDDEVNKKVFLYTQRINEISNISLKNKLSTFINQAKDKLLNDNDGKLNNIDDLDPDTPKNNIISAGSTYIIDNYKSKQTSKNVQQVYATDIAKGTITTLKKKSTTTTFCISSLFRDSNSNSSTDCIYYLPYTLKNVTSMEVTSVEIPQSIFLFSEKIGSNTIYFKEYSSTPPLEGLVTLPPGNYKTGSSPDLITTLENSINNQLGTGTRFTVSIDPATYKITITNSTYIFNMFILYLGTNKNINRTLGWILGYRKPYYENEKSYITESIYNNTPANYLYLEINDFNEQQRATSVFGLFSESFLGSNIISKICYTNSTNYTSFDTVVYEEKYVLGSPREYFGPTNLQKMYIRLLDEYGYVVDLNGLDFSFTLQLKILYDV